MKTIRQSMLAVIIAVVSTAALGPGTFFRQGADDAGRRALLPASRAPSTLPELEASMRAPLPGLAFAALDAAMADASLENADFIPVDFAQAQGNPNGHALPAGSAGFFPGSAIQAGLHAGYGGTAAGPAYAPGQSTRLARTSGLQAPGFNAGPAPAGPSAISLDDPALVDRDIQQAPLLSLTPPKDSLDEDGQSGNGAAGEAAAVPEPATMLLLGLGLAGLLAARSGKRAPGDRAQAARAYSV
jgi:hypothetical protein